MYSSISILHSKFTILYFVKHYTNIISKNQALYKKISVTRCFLRHGFTAFMVVLGQFCMLQYEVFLVTLFCKLFETGLVA